jgi:hypothetical protein
MIARPKSPRYALPLPVLLLAALLPTGLSGQATDSTWTPELAMQYRAIQGTALSPDGSMVAWVVRDPVMEGRSPST